MVHCLTESVVQMVWDFHYLEDFNILIPYLIDYK